MRDDLLTPPSTTSNGSLPTRQVHDLYARGVRYAELHEPVNLSSPTPAICAPSTSSGSPPPAACWCAGNCGQAGAPIRP